jgi:hypothetical protein
LTSIHEITGMEGDVITMQEIFGFEQTCLADGNSTGPFPRDRYPSKVRRTPEDIWYSASGRVVRSIPAVQLEERGKDSTICSSYLFAVVLFRKEAAWRGMRGAGSETYPGTLAGSFLRLEAPNGAAEAKIAEPVSVAERFLFQIPRIHSLTVLQQSGMPFGKPLSRLYHDGRDGCNGDRSVAAFRSW